jgi:hypothetical protein
MRLLLQIDPHIGLVAAVAAHRMAFGFAFLCRNRGGFCGLFFVILQGAGDHHFSLISAIFTPTDLLDFFFGHRFLLSFQKHKGACLKTPSIGWFKNDLLNEIHFYFADAPSRNSRVNISLSSGVI